MNIGDLFLQLLADGSKLTPSVQAEAAKAGDAGAKTLGQRLAGGLKTNGIKAFGAVASAAFGIATKGALELEEVQARITAETGASADEAKATAKVINRVAGEERMSLEAVSDIAIKVRRDLGAVGPQADELTAKIARFARVTRQDGGAAVSDIDDLVDAWGLSLDDVGGLLDKLIVSGQKWGGSIEADQKALAAMAPTLKAFNLNIDDGIALLDLFKASGLDAAQVPKALTSALQKLDGRPIKDFVAELAAIEDPTERAQRAIEVFGSKAGVQLANAIKPGMTSLDDLGISAEESQGALDKAADALDSTFGARFQRLLSEAGATLRQFGSDFGPLVTGAASIASLGGALGLDEFVKKFGGKMLEAGKAGGEALIDGIGTVTGAAGTVIGNLVAQALDPHNPFLNGVIGKAAQGAGRLWSTAFGLAIDVAEGTAAAIARIPGVSKVGAAVDKAGAFLGTKFGKAFGLAAAAGAIFWFLDEWNNQRTGLAAQGEQIGADIAASIARGNLEELKNQRAALSKALTELMGMDPASFGQFDPLKPFRTLLASDEIDRMQRELGDLDAAIAALQQTTQEPVIDPKTFIGPPVPPDLLKKQGETAGDLMAQGFVTGIRHGGHGVVNEIARLRSLTISQIVQMTPEARAAMAQVFLAAAGAIRDKRAAIDAALDQLREDIKNRLSPRKEVALRIGQLFGKTLARGLRDSDPLIRKQAEGTRALIEDQLIETVRAGGEAGKKIQEELERKLKSKDPAVRDQAKRTKSLIDAALKQQPPKTPGEVIGDQLGRDLRNSNSALGSVAYSLGRTIAQNLIAGVQGAAPVSSGGGGGGGGARRRQHGGPVTAGEAYIVGEAGPEWFVPRTPGVVLPNPAPGAGSVPSSAAPAAAAASGDTFNLYLPDAQHRDPWTVLDRLPRYAKVAKAAAGESGWKAA